ncbi:MAG: hypothetical protein JW712_13680 [Dehalococcoidales bacterium]|nr:hypothetical protein [Dehalococcoidales bacterium]
MKHLKSKILLALTIALILAITVSPVKVAAAMESLTLSSDVAVLNQEVTVTGSGFDTNSAYQVNIIFGLDPGSEINYTTTRHEIVKTVSVNTGGTFTATFFIPPFLRGATVTETVTNGTYFVYATYRVTTTTGYENTRKPLGKTAINILGGSMTMSRDSGPPGTEITLSANNFGANEQLQIRLGEEALMAMGTPKADSTGRLNSLKAYIPVSTAGVHGLTITGQTTYKQAGRLFTVTPKLEAESELGTATDLVNLRGAGFSGNVGYTITIGSTSISSDITDSYGSFSCPPFNPSPFGSGDLTFTATDVNGNTAQFQYSLYDISVSLTPESGSPGGYVDIAGSGFEPKKTITISFPGLGSSHDITLKSDADGHFVTSFEALWKEMGTYEIKVSDGENTKTAHYEVTTSSNIYPLTNITSPSYIGTDIFIAGDGFSPGKTLTVTWDGTSVATYTVPSDGVFSAANNNQINFQAPVSSSGEHTIIATDGINSIEYRFWIENVPPAQVTTVLPITGSKAEAQTFFDWDDIEDPSGVIYTLQVATNQAFSQESLVHEERNLTVSEFTLPGKLNAVTEQTPYYWRVKATDLAGNEGAWSNPSAFFIGFKMSLPQGAIYAIIIGVALALAVFTFWLGRKTAYY